MSNSDDEKRQRGRPPGSANKMAQEAREKAKATGLLPHEILLSIARGEPQKNPVVDPKTGKVCGATWIVADLEQRKGAAQAAAPYFAPRIQAVEVTHGISDESLDELIKSLAAETGTSLGTSGEGPPPALPGEAARGRRQWSDDDEDPDGD